ncbi:MAG TPA: hypothetical protein VGO62_09520 [Myxococcota bacterium]
MTLLTVTAAALGCRTPPAPDAPPPPPASATTTSATTASATTASADDASAPHGTAFDRILCKPVDTSVDPQVFASTLAGAAHLDVKMARHTALKWILIALTPTNPPRAFPEQQAAIDAIKATSLCESVEGDRMMKAR